MPVIEVEIANVTNANARFEPIGETVRGGFQVARARTPEAGALVMSLPAGVPGQRIRLDTDKGVGSVIEPLTAPEHKATRQALARLVTQDENADEGRLQFAPAVKEYPNAHAGTWVGWMVRLVRSGVAKLTAGKLPDKVPADAKPRQFSPPEQPDERDQTIRQLTALLVSKLSADEKKAFAGLLNAGQ